MDLIKNIKSISLVEGTSKEGKKYLCLEYEILADGITFKFRTFDQGLYTMRQLLEREAPRK